MAAAFAALVSLKHNLYLILTHPHHSLRFEEEQIKSLWESASFLIYFIKSNDNSHGPRREATEALERRIARAAQAAEDVIESHVVDQIHGGDTRRSKTAPSRFLLDLQKVIEAMDFMSRKALNIYTREAQSGVEAEQQPTYSAAPLTSNKTPMVGFNGVLQLLDLLTGVPSSRRVIPIVGMGGIGKTTLARTAFEHPLIVERFDICLWATISQKYKVKKILAQLLSIDESTSGTDDELGERLYKSLCGRRYLIVIDDMWSLQAWNEIQFFFPNTVNGSRVVVTTRHSYVAKGLSNVYLAMHCLDANSSWDLFCQRAFAEQCCPPNLEEIGKKIVEKCKGLPLAIVVVGGHLKKSSRALQYWESVAQDMNSISSSTEDDQCLNALSLSYSYLPAHLKPCFLVLGAFPEDQRIHAMDVIKIWIAEGFIEPCTTCKTCSLEVVAQRYLQDLFDRNLLFLAGTMDYNGDIYSFMLHDLVRELCLKVAQREEFLYVLDDPRAINLERRVVISGDVTEVNHQIQTFDAPIRCLIYEGDQLSSYNLRLLRTLTKVVTTSTSESLLKQVNLRYLKVDLIHKRSRILYLPSSISLLWNLQMLTIIVPDQSKVIAPYEIWEMVQLRHLEVEPVCLPDPLLLNGVEQANRMVLRHLDKLLEVENFRLSEEVCRRVPNVRELRLSYCDEPDLCYCPHNLRYFHRLQFLVCKFDSNFKWHDFAVSLTFPISLKELHLSGCRLDWEEVTMIGSLPNLVSLRLYPNSVTGSVWTPAEGRFVSLRNLDIWGNDDLVYWNADSTHFPVLQNLYIKNLSNLNKFPSGIGDIPTLKWIELRFCNRSLTISAMRTLVEQEEQGNEDLQLNVSFRGDEETLKSFNVQVEDEGLTSKNLSLRLHH